jgi:integrase
MPKRTNDGLKKRCGCARKRWTQCEHGWHFSYSRGTFVNAKGKLTKREYRFSLDTEAAKRGEPRPAKKDDAILWRDRLRAEIREGKHEALTLDPTAPLTFGDVCDHYLREYVRIPSRRAGALKQMEDHIRLARTTDVPAANGARVRLELKPIAAVTATDLKALRQARLAASAARAAAGFEDAKGGEVGANRLLARVRHLFTWAIENDYVIDSPFRKGHAAVVKPNRKAETARHRRLISDEETQLLKHANPHLYALIVAALTTGCRKDELLSMQWQQVRETPKPGIFIPAAKAKTEKPRTVPLTARLRAVLAMRRSAPDGTEHAPDAYVFGNEVGERVKNFKRAWDVAVLKAHGHTPRYVVKVVGEGDKRRKLHTANLTAESRAALRAIDLHFHDLRREAGSRWLEAGVSLAQVRDWLGHTTISQTTKYLAVSEAGTEDALRRVEAFEAGFAQVSHKPLSDDTQAGSTDQAEPVVM